MSYVFMGRENELCHEEWEYRLFLLWFYWLKVNRTTIGTMSSVPAKLLVIVIIFISNVIEEYLIFF
jgi:hypothetical protein